MPESRKDSLNRKSRLITEGDKRSPNRAMLRAVGFNDGDFEKPIIGVANGQSNITPCNAGLGKLADIAMAEIKTVAACHRCSAPSPSATASPWAPKA